MHAPRSNASRGVLASLGSSVTFGLIYFLTPMLSPMSAEGIWAVRILVSVPFMALVLISLRQWRFARDVGARLLRSPSTALGLLVCAALLAGQLWLFAWAPLHGRGLQVALGYFLLPLVLVVVGRFLYRDRMVWWQWLAAGVATIGVAYEVFRIGGVGWETLFVALGYPVYFVLRRKLGTAHLGGQWWEMVFMAPVALILALREFGSGVLLSEHPLLWLAAPAFSLFAASGLLLYLLASRMLSMSLFGLLSYVEPALLVVASLLIGEHIAPGEFFTYGAIWSAVLVLVLGGASETLHARRRPTAPDPAQDPAAGDD